MKYIKYFEELNGTEIPNFQPPVYGKEQMPITLNSTQLNTIFSKITNKYYTEDDYLKLYNEHLKYSGKILYGFTPNNLDTVLLTIKKGEQ